MLIYIQIHSKKLKKKKYFSLERQSLKSLYSVSLLVAKVG